MKIENTIPESPSFRLIDLRSDLPYKEIQPYKSISIVPGMVFTLRNNDGDGLLEITDSALVKRVRIDSKPAFEVNHLCKSKVVEIEIPGDQDSDLSKFSSHKSETSTKTLSICVLETGQIRVNERDILSRRNFIETIAGKYPPVAGLIAKKESIINDVPTPSKISRRSAYIAFTTVALFFMSIGLFLANIDSPASITNQDSRLEHQDHNPSATNSIDIDENTHHFPLADNPHQDKELASKKVPSSTRSSNNASSTKPVKVDATSLTDSEIARTRSLPATTSKQSLLSDQEGNELMQMIESYKLEANFNPEGVIEKLAALSKQHSDYRIRKRASKALNEIRDIHGL